MNERADEGCDAVVREAKSGSFSIQGEFDGEYTGVL